MIYEWKIGSRLNVDAQAVGERLKKIEARAGELTPDLVVKDARKPASPLHGAFEWDDSEAAKQYRLQQAGQILRSIVVSIPGADGEPKVVRAFVNITDGAGYEDVNVVLRTADKRALLLARAKKELEEWRRRYEDFEELVEVVRAIDAVQQRDEAAD